MVPASLPLNVFSPPLISECDAVLQGFAEHGVLGWTGPATGPGRQLARAAVEDGGPPPLPPPKSPAELMAEYKELLLDSKGTACQASTC